MDTETNALGLVIPTINSRNFIQNTITLLCTELVDKGLREIIVVDDGSEQSIEFIIAALATKFAGVRFVLIEMARNVGQTAATTIGLVHSTASVVVTVDDDLQFDHICIAQVTAALGHKNDFVVGAPQTYGRHGLRSISSRIVRYIGVTSLSTPRDFVFSSLTAYRREFINRVREVQIPTTEIGWMFRLTSRYKNTAITPHGVSEQRSHSNYQYRQLIMTIKPLIRLWSRKLSIQMSVVALLLGTAAMTGALYFLISALQSRKSVPGFATLSVMSSLNISLLLLFASAQLRSSSEKRIVEHDTLIASIQTKTDFCRTLR